MSKSYIKDILMFISSTYLRQCFNHLSHDLCDDIGWRKLVQICVWVLLINFLSHKSICSWSTQHCDVTKYIVKHMKGLWWNRYQKTSRLGQVPRTFHIFISAINCFEEAKIMYITSDVCMVLGFEWEITLSMSFIDYDLICA